MELAEQTIEEIRTLTCVPDAQIIVASGTVCWSDELGGSAFPLLCTEDEWLQIQRLFAIRARYWDTGTMGHDDRLYWEESRRQFPNWPIFQRLEPSVEQREALEAQQDWIALIAKVNFSLADEIEVRSYYGFEFCSFIFNRDSFLKRTRKRAGWQFWHGWWSKLRGRATRRAVSKLLNRKKKS